MSFVTAQPKGKRSELRVGILGDCVVGRPPRVTIEPAIQQAANALSLSVSTQWLNNSALGESDVADFDALLIAPGGADEDTGNILSAIRYAREQGRPCLGTCGGLQRMATEYALNVLGYGEVAHAELTPDAPDPLFTGLSCQITGVTGRVMLRPKTLVAACYGGLGEVEEVFYCRFGMNPLHVPPFEIAGFKVCGVSPDGTPRILVLEGHPFFIGTLFVPQVTSSEHAPHPLLLGLLRAARAQVTLN